MAEKGPECPVARWRCSGFGTDGGVMPQARQGARERWNAQNGEACRLETVAGCKRLHDLPTGRKDADRRRFRGKRERKTEVDLQMWN